MSRLRYNWDEARRHLRDACPELRLFIDDFGSARLRVRGGDDLFRALAASIAYQQLSGKAAATIHGRFESLFEGGRPVPEQTLALGFDRLRGCGLSRNKALAILDLADKAQAGELPSPRRLGRLDDEEIVERLCTVRGIGPWTVHMHLIFCLGRPDVMPATDLGVQKGVEAVYGLETTPAPAEVLERTAHLAPYRSAASWYFWRAAEAGAN
ncbi:MAG: DNA-3-methyladenine glycosylase 2 family protein [Gammaproteobacteria bacterium]